MQAKEETKITNNDVKVDFQSLKFEHYQPQAIEAMAVTQDRKLVAVARENNSIEVWIRNTWVQLFVIPGNKNSAIRNLHWVEYETSQGQGNEINPLYGASGHARRLISTGLNGVVIEWDLRSHTMKTKLSVSAAIWSSKVVGKNLYLACEDCSIKTLRIKKDRFEHGRSAMRAESRCLSLEVSSDERYIFGGYADSSIRRWNTQTLQCELHFLKQSKRSTQRIQERQECLIWTLKLVGDGDNQVLFSGDSQGQLCGWDTEHGTLVQSFDNLKADISCIETNEEKSIVYATGIDARIMSV